MLKVWKNQSFIAYSIAESFRSSSFSWRLGVLFWKPAIWDDCGKLTGAGPFLIEIQFKLIRFVLIYNELFIIKLKQKIITKSLSV